MRSEKRPLITTRDTVILGMMVAVLEVSKRLLDSIPNVELITFLLIMFTLFMGRKVILAAYAFTALEIAWWGVHVWVIMYLYVWPFLILVTYRFRERASARFCAVVAAVFGLSFGALCSIPYLFIGGPVMMVTWWIAGIPYDILHCISNFVICLVLFRPAEHVLGRCREMLENGSGQGSAGL